MKSWKLLLVLSFSFIQNATGQTVIEEVYQGSDLISFSRVFLNANGDWIVSGSSNPYGSVDAGTYFIRSINDQGLENWQYHNWLAAAYPIFPQTSAPKVGSVRITESGEILTSGFEEQCDYSEPYSYLIKLDGSGTQLWEISFPHENSWSGGSGFTQIAEGIDSLIAIASSDSVVILLDSIVTNKWASLIDPIHYLRWETDSTLLVNAGSKTIRFHENGALLDSVSLVQSDSGIDIRTQNGEIWVLTNGSIEVFSQELQPISEIDLSAFTGSRFDFVDVLGDVWFTDGNVLVSIDEQYNLSQVLEFDFQDVSVAVNDSLVMTATTVSQNDKFSGLMKSYKLDGTKVSNDQDDVEIMVTVDSTYAIPHPIWPTADGYAVCQVDIVNHSTDSLYELLVSSPEHPPYAFCGIPVMAERLASLNLASGDTFSFETPPILLFVGSNELGDTTIERSVCVTAQSPNNHLDANPTDNVACATASFLLDVDEQESKAKLKVYPNPTTGIVNLPQIENLSWQLFDATGRMLVNGSGEKQIDLNSLNLPEQLYFLRLLTDENSTTVKLILQL